MEDRTRTAVRPKRFRRLQAVLDRRQPDLTVLMEKVHKPHNFSAILRNCDAAGVLEVHAVPATRGLELHRRTSSSAAKWVQVHEHSEFGAAARHLKANGLSLVAADIGVGSVDYRELDYTVPTAFVMGTEKFGLSELGRELADHIVTVPMYGMIHSLNVSVATSLLLYEAVRQREAAGMYDQCRLSPSMRERMLFEWSYPRIAGECRRSDRPYPALDDEGAITDSAFGSVAGAGPP